MLAALAAAERVLSKRAGAGIVLADPEDLGGSDRSVVARARVVRNPFSRQARERLEFLYRASHKGTLGGLDEMIKKAQAAMSP